MQRFEVGDWVQSTTSGSALYGQPFEVGRVLHNGNLIPLGGKYPNGRMANQGIDPRRCEFADRPLRKAEKSRQFAAAYGESPVQQARILAYDIETLSQLNDLLAGMTAAQINDLYSKIKSAVGIGPLGSATTVHRPKPFHLKEKSMSAPQAPSCTPAAAYPWQVRVGVTAAERLSQAEAEVKAAEAALVAETEARARQARLNYEIGLASATLSLLNQISGVHGRIPMRDFAQYRKELQPLANSYGLKLVLIGDRSTATLVEVA